MKRLFDLGLTLPSLILLSPLLMAIAIFIVIDSRGGAFFHQQRVGKNGKLFFLHKFRTMRPSSESSGQLTVGMRDPRITRLGYFLRKYKLDELPQLLNIIKGEMSLVGPRPEVPKYVHLYTEAQRRVLSIKPGLTDYASIEFVNENEILAKSDNPEKTYIEIILPEKLRLNLRYIEETSVKTDMKILLATIRAIIK